MSEQGTHARDEGARLLQAGDLAGAQQRLLQAVGENPGDARAHTYLGICKTRQGDPSGGIESLREAVRLAPADAVFRYNLGVALSQAARTDEAKTELAEAMRLNPNHAGARELLHRLQSAPAGVAPSASAPPPTAVPPPAAFPPQQQQQYGAVQPAPSNWAPPVPNPPPIGGQAPGAPTGWTPPMPSVPIGGQPDATAAAGVWNPAPVPGQAPAGWAPPPGPAAPMGDPNAGGWAPAPPAPGMPQQDAYTGSPAAMYYAQDQMAGGQEPGLGKRLLRGWLWGIVYGQWWTLWTIISMFIWRSSSIGPGMIGVAIFYAIGYGFFGSLVGLIIGAANLDEDQAVYAGVGAGMVILGLEFLLSGSAGALINIIFYFFTGRYVGRGIAGRVQQPV